MDNYHKTKQSKYLKFSFFPLLFLYLLWAGKISLMNEILMKNIFVFWVSMLMFGLPGYLLSRKIEGRGGLGNIFVGPALGVVVMGFALSVLVCLGMPIYPWTFLGTYIFMIIGIIYLPFKPHHGKAENPIGKCRMEVILTLIIVIFLHLVLILSASDYPGGTDPNANGYLTEMMYQGHTYPYLYPLLNGKYFLHLYPPGHSVICILVSYFTGISTFKIYVNFTAFSVLAVFLLIYQMVYLSSRNWIWSILAACFSMNRLFDEQHYGGNQVEAMALLSLAVLFYGISKTTLKSAWKIIFISIFALTFVGFNRPDFYVWAFFGVSVYLFFEKIKFGGWSNIRSWTSILIPVFSFIFLLFWYFPISSEGQHNMQTHYGYVPFYKIIVDNWDVSFAVLLLIGAISGLFTKNRVYLIALSYMVGLLILDFVAYKNWYTRIATPYFGFRAGMCIALPILASYPIGIMNDFLEGRKKYFSAVAAAILCYIYIPTLTWDKLNIYNVLKSTINVAHAERNRDYEALEFLRNNSDFEKTLILPFTHIENPGGNIFPELYNNYYGHGATPISGRRSIFYSGWRWHGRFEQEPAWSSFIYAYRNMDNWKTYKLLNDSGITHVWLNQYINSSIYFDQYESSPFLERVFGDGPNDSCIYKVNPKAMQKKGEPDEPLTVSWSSFPGKEPIFLDPKKNPRLAPILEGKEKEVFLSYPITIDTDEMVTLGRIEIKGRYECPQIPQLYYPILYGTYYSDHEIPEKFFFFYDPLFKNDIKVYPVRVSKINLAPLYGWFPCHQKGLWISSVKIYEQNDIAKIETNPELTVEVTGDNSANTGARIDGPITYGDTQWGGYANSTYTIDFGRVYWIDRISLSGVDVHVGAPSYIVKIWDGTDFVDTSPPISFEGNPGATSLFRINKTATSKIQFIFDKGTPGNNFVYVKNISVHGEPVNLKETAILDRFKKRLDLAKIEDNPKLRIEVTGDNSANTGARIDGPITYGDTQWGGYANSTYTLDFGGIYRIHRISLSGVASHAGAPSYVVKIWDGSDFVDTSPPSKFEGDPGSTTVFRVNKVATSKMQFIFDKGTPGNNFVYVKNISVHGEPVNLKETAILDRFKKRLDLAKREDNPKLKVEVWGDASEWTSGNQYAPVSNLEGYWSGLSISSYTLYLGGLYWVDRISVSGMDSHMGTPSFQIKIWDGKQFINTSPSSEFEGDPGATTVFRLNKIATNKLKIIFDKGSPENNFVYVKNISVYGEPVDLDQASTVSKF